VSRSATKSAALRKAEWPQKEEEDSRRSTPRKAGSEEDKRELGPASLIKIRHPASGLKLFCRDGSFF
jgi:hypothetical protein